MAFRYKFNTRKNNIIKLLKNDILLRVLSKIRILRSFYIYLILFFFRYTQHALTNFTTLMTTVPTLAMFTIANSYLYCTNRLRNYIIIIILYSIYARNHPTIKMHETQQSFTPRCVY